MKLKKGFTLIEMLTVIFIIGITTAAFLRLNNLGKDYSDYERQIASSIYQEIDSELEDFKRNKIILSGEDNGNVYEQEYIRIDLSGGNNLKLTNIYYNRDDKNNENDLNNIRRVTNEKIIVENSKIRTRKDIKKGKDMEISFIRTYNGQTLTKDGYFMILDSIENLFTTEQIEIIEEENSNSCHWISTPRKPRRKTLICNNGTYTQSNNNIIQKKQPNQISFGIKINDNNIGKITINASTLTVKLEYCCKDQNNCRANEIICNG